VPSDMRVGDFFRQERRVS